MDYRFRGAPAGLLQRQQPLRARHLRAAAKVLGFAGDQHESQDGNGPTRDETLTASPQTVFYFLLDLLGQLPMASQCSAFKVAMLLDGRELETFPHSESAVCDLGYLRLGKYFPFCAERRRLYAIGCSPS